jgi:pilus assembly protein CpaF
MNSIAGGRVDVLSGERTRRVSPLLEIERAVQERAKEIALDMAVGEGPARLRRLIDEEVARWREDFVRGRREYDLADPEFVADRAWRNLVGYGPLASLLPQVT